MRLKGSNDMNEIKLKRMNGAEIRKSGVQVRVAADINKELMELSEEVGMTKTLLVDILLRHALNHVVVED